jgi:Glyoxalase/Bleomycin resistance protein/Dioxygenase superfamily
VLGKLDVFHVGVVVDDLDAAMTAMGANLGIRWAPVQERTQTVRRGDGEVRREAIRFTYSVDGPPHLELIDSASDALWATTPPGCLHHVGAFADDVTLAPGPGMTLEFGGGDGPEPVGFAYYTAPGGIRVELVDAGRKADFERWWSGGELKPADAAPG